MLLAGRRAEAIQVARNYVQQVYQHRDYIGIADDIAMWMCLLLPEAMPTDAQIAARLQPWWKQVQLQRGGVLHDALQRIRSVQSTRRRAYSKAIQELKAGRTSYQIPYMDTLWFAWLYKQQGKRADAQWWLRQARKANSGDHPNFWDGILFGRVLFPEEWEKSLSH